MPKKAEATRGAAESGKRYPLNMRTTFEIRSLLEQAADRTGRSLAQEAELRIEQSFARQASALEGLELAYGNGFAGILLALGEAMKGAGTLSTVLATRRPPMDGAWWKNPYAYDEALKAAAAVLERFRPDGKIESRDESPGAQWAWEVAEVLQSKEEKHNPILNRARTLVENAGLKVSESRQLRKDAFISKSSGSGEV